MQQPSRFLDAGTPPHIITLVLMAAVGALNMNIFLPSLPGMAAWFETDYALVQLTVSLYLAGTALLQLFLGPLSDRFGRRPVMLASLWLFLAATLVCVFAPTIEILLIGRVLQSVVIAGLVLSRAVVRDMVGTAKAASMIGYVTMGMTLVPMLGPTLGGILDQLFGWQANFVVTFIFGVIVLVVVWRDLGETNETMSASFAQQFRAYPELLRARRFWGYALTATFASGAFFSFLGGGPYVASNVLGMAPHEVGYHFFFIALGYMIGNFLAGRFSIVIGLNPMMVIGNFVAACGMVLSIGLFLAGFFHPMAFFGPIFFVGFGNGMTLPNANAGVVSVRPHLAGSASGLGGAMMIGGGAGLSVIASASLSPETGPYPLLVTMLISSMAGVAASLYVVYASRRSGVAATALEDAAPDRIVGE
ncbi:multidrug effflux MFS transporter [Pararhizobium haloflavum]|uniref:multidrug effflux MFS transporter n=1 Tax=Pararhizobium haloflavum TaxID=2037914 RepID=UPI000C176A6A|nr:multidrug effflux MFS transporter [Pararhizobium haloflavum]